ncbi:MAG: RNA-binding protein [Lysobacteraceae bacterium]|nr:MAG: RNA-binding protein [Xanthomonadaceae bacterium]
MAQPLSPAQRRHLRALAHPLKPVILLGGKGATEPVIEELRQALEHHELVKVRLCAEDREGRDAQARALCEATGAALVQRIGHVAVLFRRSTERPTIVLPRNP